MDNVLVNRKVCGENYNAIDLFKFIMSICVVAIHTRPFSDCSYSIGLEIYNGFIQCSAPYFFICAGFFLGKKLIRANHDEKWIELSPLLDYLKRIFLMYVLWSIIYLPLAIVGFWKWNDGVIEAVAKWIRNFFLVGENYNSWMLWYLLSSIYAIIFVYILLKKGYSIKAITVIGLVMIALGLAIDQLVKYDGNIPYILALFRKGISVTILSGCIFRSFFYVPIGILFASQRCIRLDVGIILLILGLGTYCIFEGILAGFATVMTSVGLFMMIANMKLPHAKLYRKLRQISTDIYFVHLMIWSAYVYIVYGEETFNFDSFAWTVILSIFTSYILSFIRVRRKNNEV